MMALGLLHDDACVKAVKVEDSIVKGTNRPVEMLAILKHRHGVPFNLLGINGRALQITQKLLVWYCLDVEKHNTHVLGMVL